MTKRILCTLFILITTTITHVNLYAQPTKCTITGKLVDEKEMPIAYASAVLYNEKSPIAGAVTDDQGKFSLTVKQGNSKYRLVISYIGYKQHEIQLTPNTLHINLGTIRLNEVAASLDEVVISAKGLHKNQRWNLLPLTHLQIWQRVKVLPLTFSALHRR